MFQFVQEARDQTQPGSLFSRSGGRGERDPGNEVAYMYHKFCIMQYLFIYLFLLSLAPFP